MATPRKRDDLPHLAHCAGLGQGLRDVMRESVERAARQKTRLPNGTAVHSARRALKRARAVLRLGEAIGIAGVKTARRRLARHARALSPLRDATVVAKLAERFGPKVPAAARPGLTELQSEKTPRPTTTWWAAWKRRLAGEMRRVDGLEWGEPTAHDIDRALQRSARRVCKWARCARRSHDITTAHEWRKAVIVLREQVLVAQPLLGRDAIRLHAHLHELAHVLGTATDCEVFLEAVRDRDWPAELREAQAQLCAFARKRRKRSLKRARKRWSETRRILEGDFS